MATRAKVPPNQPGSIQESLRWPNLFSNLDQAQSLVGNPAWSKLSSDLDVLRVGLEYRLIHDLKSMEEINFFRGQIAILENLLGLPAELAEWKQSHR